MVNPRTLHGQAIGGIVQGLGGTFLEASRVRRGRPAPYRFARRLCNADGDRLPDIMSHSNLEEYPSPNNPLGAKGAGEGGIIPVGGIYRQRGCESALGVQPKSLPMSPSRVWGLINP